MSSHRITVPEGHVAVILPLDAAAELDSFATTASKRHRKRGETLFVRLWDCIRLAIHDAMVEYNR